MRKTNLYPACLSIAGSDPSGGAGIQADLKTFHQHRVYGMAVISLLTVQNTKTVAEVVIIKPELILAQIKAVISDIETSAVKTGALGNAESIDAVSMALRDTNFPLIIDPVMVSKHGLPLLDGEAQDILRRQLLRRAHLITPNIPEAEALSERNISNPITMEKAAATIAKLGIRHVLIKGGHLEDESTDVLWSEGQAIRFPSARIETKNTHGTGCVLSAAITAHIARGRSVPDAVKRAKAYIEEAIRSAPGFGSGFGPVNIHATVEL